MTTDTISPEKVISNLKSILKLRKKPYIEAELKDILFLIDSIAGTSYLYFYLDQVFEIAKTTDIDAMMKDSGIALSNNKYEVDLDNTIITEIADDLKTCFKERHSENMWQIMGEEITSIIKLNLRRLR